MSARRLAVVMVALALGGTVAGRPSVAAQTAVAATQHVILVSIDGFAAYHLNNPALDLPNLRALAAAGAVAESSETVFPSMTHPSHTTLITGVTPRRHGVVDNDVVNRTTGESFHITSLPRSQSIKTQTLFDAVKAGGRRNAAFFWPETRDDAAIADNVAEVFRKGGGADPDAVTPGLLAELRAAGIPIDTFYEFYDDPYAQGAGDIALTQAAAYVFAKRRPALTALHLLVTDKAQHEFGAAHYMSAAALQTADYCLGLLRQAVKDAGRSADTTFVIVADHGFVTVRDDMDIASLVAEPALDGHVRWATNKWYAYATLQPSFNASRDGAALERVLTRLAGTAGIGRIIRPADLAGLGFPDYEQNPYALGHYIVAADIDLHLVLGKDAPKRRPKAKPYHGHGYLPSQPMMYPIQVWSGAGIASGRALGHVRNIDVAPTVAALLGVPLSGVEGRVLDAALASAVR